jgi:uncharacterized integral membrane protein (TIGR00697 family)
MSLTLTIFWIIIVSLTSVIGAYYVRRSNRPDAIIAFYVGLVGFSNIVASKTVEFDLIFKTVFAPAAALIFPVTFLLTDVVNEKFGRKETQRMIFIAFLSQIGLILLSQLVVRATPAPFFTNHRI